MEIRVETKRMNWVLAEKEKFPLDELENIMVNSKSC